MRRDGAIAANRSWAAVGTALVLAALVGCNRGPVVETTLVFDGQTRTISTNDVSCVNQLDGKLVIFVDDGRERLVRVVLDRRFRLVVYRVALRHTELSGFVADPNEVAATKIDDTYTFSGRMPPNEGENQWHLFKIVTTCPGYQEEQPRRPTRSEFAAPIFVA